MSSFPLYSLRSLIFFFLYFFSDLSNFFAAVPTCFTWLEKSVFPVTKNVDVTAYVYIYKISYYILLYSYIIPYIICIIYILFFILYLVILYSDIYIYIVEKTLYIHRLKCGSLAFQS